MLNIPELKNRFTEILNSFTSEDLENWIEFAEARERIEKEIQIDVISDWQELLTIKNRKNEEIDNA